MEKYLSKKRELQAADEKKEKPSPSTSILDAAISGIGFVKKHAGLAALKLSREEARRLQELEKEKISAQLLRDKEGILKALVPAMRSLVKEDINQEIKGVDGKVILIEDRKRIKISIGKNQGLFPHDNGFYLQAYVRKKKKNGYKKKRRALLRPTEIEDDFCYAELYIIGRIKSLQPGMRVEVVRALQ